MIMCPQAKYDIASTAALFSTLAGVLAGFAFTSLIALVGFRAASTRDTERLASVIQVLLAAVLALSCSSLTYAALGGERMSSGRAASVQVAAGVGFSAAGLLLVYSIALTIEVATPDPPTGDNHLVAASRLVRRVLVHGVAPLLVLSSAWASRTTSLSAMGWIGAHQRSATSRWASAASRSL